MSLFWLAVLLTWGFIYGWAEVPSLAWWTLLPFVVGDMAIGKDKE